MADDVESSPEKVVSEPNDLLRPIALPVEDVKPDPSVRTLENAMLVCASEQYNDLMKDMSCAEDDFDFHGEDNDTLLDVFEESMKKLAKQVPPRTLDTDRFFKRKQVVGTSIDLHVPIACGGRDQDKETAISLPSDLSVEERLLLGDAMSTNFVDKKPGTSPATVGPKAKGKAKGKAKSKAKAKATRKEATPTKSTAKTSKDPMDLKQTKKCIHSRAYHHRLREALAEGLVPEAAKCSARIAAAEAVHSFFSTS